MGKSIQNTAPKGAGGPYSITVPRPPPPERGGQPPHPSPPARSPQCDMQKLTVDELKRLLYDTFCEHLSMKDIENIIMTEEESHMGTAEECPVDVESECQPAGDAKSHHQPRRHGDGTGYLRYGGRWVGCLG